MAEKRATIVRGGRLINPGGQRAEAADILIAGDSVAEVGPPGLTAPADANVIDARDRLMHPGTDQRTHARPRQFGARMGDRWTLELLLAAGPGSPAAGRWRTSISATYVGAIEMLLKGCTACYDLTSNFRCRAWRT